MKHLNIKITGKVQGVWYRGSAQRKALELGLKGFVRNEPDGSVYAEVEGTSAALEAFCGWCREGPELANVENVEVSDGEWQDFQTFEILR